MRRNEAVSERKRTNLGLRTFPSRPWYVRIRFPARCVRAACKTLLRARLPPVDGDRRDHPGMTKWVSPRVHRLSVARRAGCLRVKSRNTFSSMPLVLVSSAGDTWPSRSHWSTVTLMMVALGGPSPLAHDLGAIRCRRPLCRKSRDSCSPPWNALFGYGRPDSQSDGPEMRRGGSV